MRVSAEACQRRCRKIFHCSPAAVWPDHLESGFFRSTDCQWEKTYSLLLLLLRSVYWASWVIIFKFASANENSLKTVHFYIGFVLYASTAFGWVFVMKHLKLATIGVVYSVSMVLLLTAMGVVFLPRISQLL